MLDPLNSIHIWQASTQLSCLNVFKLVNLRDLNLLAPGRLDWSISCEIALRWMSLDLTDDKLTLVQVMAWCRQATSHYLSQCWPRSMWPYGVTRPQWVKCSIFNKLHIFWCTVKKFCVEFRMVPLKFRTNYLIHTLKDTILIHCWKFKNSEI